MTSPRLPEWNQTALMMQQALLGFISPNFRLMTLDHNGCEWVMHFVLETDSVEDRDEIESAVSDWEGMYDSPVPHYVEIEVCKGPYEEAATIGALALSST